MLVGIIFNVGKIGCGFIIEVKNLCKEYLVFDEIVVVLECVNFVIL